MYLSGQGRPRPLAVPLLFFLNFGLSPQARCPLSRAESCRERAGDGRTQRPLRALEITGSLPTSTIQSVAVPIGRACANGKGRLILSPTLRRAWPPRRGPRGRHMRSRYRCSMCSAIHINSRSWLRSSSTHEPSDPPLKVITLIFFFFSAASPRERRHFRQQICFCEEWNRCGGLWAAASEGLFKPGGRREAELSRARDRRARTGTHKFPRRRGGRPGRKHPHPGLSLNSGPDRCRPSPGDLRTGEYPEKWSARPRRKALRALDNLRVLFIFWTFCTLFVTTGARGNRPRTTTR